MEGLRGLLARIRAAFAGGDTGDPVPLWKRPIVLAGTGTVVLIAVVAIVALSQSDVTEPDASGERDAAPTPVAVSPLTPGPAPSAPAPTSPAPGQQQAVEPLAVYTPVDVHDPMIENQRAFSLLVPQGWQVTGGVHWEPNLLPLAGAVVTVADPSGRYALETFFPQAFGWTEGGLIPQGQIWLGSIVMPPMGPQQALEQLVLPQVRPAYDLLGVTAVDTSQLEGNVQGVRMRIGYGDGQGGLIEEEFVTTISYASVGQGGARIDQWAFGALYSLRAPAGELDSALPLLESIAASSDLDPLWFSNYQVVFDMFIARGYESIRQAGELSAMISRNHAEITQIQMDTWRNQQESFDRIHDNFVDYIRDTQRVNNNGSRTTTPSGVACRTGDGTILVLPHGSICPPDTTHLPVVQ